uniref:Uncharacterized protein n=1 Tax=Magallana gigas TaxID=29159 RepID=K1QAI7_MAGGI
MVAGQRQTNHREPIVNVGNVTQADARALYELVIWSSHICDERFDLRDSVSTHVYQVMRYT